MEKVSTKGLLKSLYCLDNGYFFRFQEKEKERKKRMEAEKSKRKPVVDMNAGLYSNWDNVLPKRTSVIGKLCHSALLIHFLFLPALFTAGMFSLAWPATHWLYVFPPFFPRLPFSHPSLTPETKNV